jgi:transcriptional regulator with XRE-family HTH domain
MTFQSEDLAPREREAYGFARVRDIAFDAVRELWMRRQASGMTQKDLAAKLGRDQGWVSRYLKGPGNWTLRTIGSFVEALDGEIEIKVYALEDPLSRARNSDAYSGYDPLYNDSLWKNSTGLPVNLGANSGGDSNVFIVNQSIPPHD